MHYCWASLPELEYLEFLFCPLLFYGVTVFADDIPTASDFWPRLLHDFSRSRLASLLLFFAAVCPTF